MAGGRPLKFKSPVELEKRIDEYFQDCIEQKIPITVTGMALWLDTSRETLCDYQTKDQFSDVIKKAKLRVENAYEIGLQSANPAGKIFVLKNMGWKDRQEVDVDMSVKINVRDRFDGDD